jgi:hypothetical protein
MVLVWKNLLRRRGGCGDGRGLIIDGAKRGLAPFTSAVSVFAGQKEISNQAACDQSPMVVCHVIGGLSSYGNRLRREARRRRRRRPLPKLRAKELFFRSRRDIPANGENVQSVIFSEDFQLKR